MEFDNVSLYENKGRKWKGNRAVRIITKENLGDAGCATGTAGSTVTTNCNNADSISATTGPSRTACSCIGDGSGGGGRGDDGGDRGNADRDDPRSDDDWSGVSNSNHFRVNRDDFRGNRDDFRGNNDFRRCWYYRDDLNHCSRTTGY